MLDEFGQRCQFLLLHQLELVDEVDKVLEARVEVVLEPQRQDLLEVRMVDVRVHSEHPFEYGFYDLAERLRKRYSDLTRKDGLVVELRLNPSHEQVDILGRWHLERGPHVLAVGP